MNDKNDIGIQEEDSDMSTSETLNTDEAAKNIDGSKESISPAQHTTKTTAEVLVDCLKAEGVKIIFGIPGEENLDLMYALKGSGIRFVVTRHEQGAAFMADVYGRLTGHPGVCLATLGPGATNLVTGVADAFLDGAPLVAITGQVSSELMQFTSHQYLDLSVMFSPITKRSKIVMRPDTVAETVRLAFKYAEEGKPGSTHIDLPKNVAHMASSAHPLRHQPQQKVYAAPNSIVEAARLISTAKNPVILAGAGAARANASGAVRAMAERLHIPVVETMMGKGVISHESTYCIGVVGIPQHDYIIDVFDQADLVIGIGYDLIECAPTKWHTHPMKIINISRLAADVNRNYEPDVEVTGDISDSIYQILRSASRSGIPTSALTIGHQLREDFDERASNEAYPMKPARILKDVRQVMGHSDILLSDVGAHKIWIGRDYPCYEPYTCLISNGFASMGFAVPGAFAAKLLNPSKQVLAITGDGGFMMNSQELETAVREHVPFVTLIWEDKHYGLIKWKEEERFGSTYGTEFTNPDFKAYAESMHCHGYRVTSTSALIPTLEKAFANSDAPSVISVPVDYSENMVLTRRLRAKYNK